MPPPKRILDRMGLTLEQWEARRKARAEESKKSKEVADKSKKK